MHKSTRRHEYVFAARVMIVLIVVITALASNGIALGARDTMFLEGTPSAVSATPTLVTPTLPAPFVALTMAVIPGYTCTSGACSMSYSCTGSGTRKMDCEFTYNFNDYSKYLNPIFTLTMEFGTGTNSPFHLYWAVVGDDYFKDVRQLITNDVNVPNISPWLPYPIGDWAYPATWPGNPTYQNFKLNLMRYSTAKDVYNVTKTFHMIFSGDPIDLSTPTPTATTTPTVTPTNTIAPTPTNDYTYNRGAAVAYADAWAHSRNSVFGNVLPPGTNYAGYQCENCTNYMSQVLLAGEYPPHGGTPDDWVENWWYTSTNSSLSWRHVTSFKNYSDVHPNEFSTVSQASLLVGGDIIMLDLYGATENDPPDNIYDHVRVVVGDGYTSTNILDYMYYIDGAPVIPTTAPESVFDILIDQNCIDRWHVAWDYKVSSDANKIYMHVID